MFGFFAKLVGDTNKKEVAKHQELVETVNNHEDSLVNLNDEQLKASSVKLKEEIRSKVDLIRKEPSLALGADNKLLSKKIDEVLEEKIAYAFALVREASKRTTGLRHFDVQIIGGAVLHRGQIAEMQTGEGKTLVASLALYLNALTGMGAYLVTVKYYLSRRDAGWMGPIYNLLGLSTGVIGPDFSYLYDPTGTNEEKDDRLKYLKKVTRREAYQADITYGTNNEFGFDYLRDNMAQAENQIVQRELTYAIVDEVDSILIDEARTPLIISAPSVESAKLYDQFAQFATRMKTEEDFKVDEKGKTISITENGIHKLEGLIGISNLYDPNNVKLVHHADVALRASALFKKNRDYMVKDGEIIIVDEFTGRLLHGRRYSAGLHQAIEAKEKVEVKEESITMATITFQNLFRLYGKLAGMTGTAATEAEELAKIYNLEVVTIPTNRPCIRTDRQDAIYKTEDAKFKAVTALVKDLQSQGQSVLIGTVSIVKSEKLSKYLKAEKVEHTVLNARYHQREGEIVAQAGRVGAVTVATNMAGRGVDIILGGAKPGEKDKSEQFKKWEDDHLHILELGGLFVIGTERHESRRIDNQLRGRSGRQGDPGISQFFLSMEDDLMRIFGGERMKNLMETLKIPEDVSINNRLLTRAIEQAQTRVEGHNFEIRKNLVEYDDVINKHREAIYRRRRLVLTIKDKPSAQWLIEETLNLSPEEQRKSLEQKINSWPDEVTSQVFKMVWLRAIDVLWVEHLELMDDLRESIGLRGYGQREPIVEYKHEALRLFNLLQENINQQALDMMMKVEVEPSKPVEQKNETPQQLILSSSDSQGKTPQRTTNGKIGRNDPCPCGAIDPNSGKPYKYKKCGLIKATHHRG